MRRQVTTTEVRCDLCGGVAGTYPCGGRAGIGWGVTVGPLDFCGSCSSVRRPPCESCGSLPTFPDPQATWAGNCLACWRGAMQVPRGCCERESWPDGFCPSADPANPVVVFCTCNLPYPHGGSHSCPDCGGDWYPDEQEDR